MSDDRIDISEPLRAILDAVGVEYRDTTQVALTVDPFTLVVDVFVRDPVNGNFMIDSTGPVTTTHTFKVKT